MLDAVIGLAVLLGSVIIHENAHGVAALALGDPTARAAGRLTLNPMKHLDPVGSVILPAVLWFSTQGQLMFGYAKPVPVTPSKLRGTDRMGFALVALAGPVSNVALAFIAVVLAKTLDVPLALGLPGAGLLSKILTFTLMWNIFIAAFNLLPIPPLDGSRLLRPFLSANGRQTLDRIEPYGFVILLLLFVFLEAPLFRIVDAIASGLLRLLPL